MSPKARALKDALAQLQKRPDDRKLQEQYLKAFPHTYKEFLGFFDTGRELADGADYIDVLPSLAKNHEAAVGNLLVQLSKDAQKEADAPTYLQEATKIYGSEHAKEFSAILSTLSNKDRKNLIEFLADVENPDADDKYQAIIDHLRELGQFALATEFEKARKERAKQPHG